MSRVENKGRNWRKRSSWTSRDVPLLTERKSGLVEPKRWRQLSAVRSNQKKDSENSNTSAGGQKNDAWPKQNRLDSEHSTKENCRKQEKPKIDVNRRSATTSPKSSSKWKTEKDSAKLP